MVNLKVEREFKGQDYTIGNFYINDVFLCNTLEDTIRIVNHNCSQKIFGQTAIPEGEYDVELIWWDKHQNWYPHIKDVSCFDGIMIHSGVTANDTEGCVLIGDNNVKGELHNGLIYMDKLRTVLKNENNISISIE
jgi:Family of unknown function (DUF5675)